MSEITVRPEVMAFAEAMERKLRVHDKERGDSWKTCDILYLHSRLGFEHGEYVDAATGPAERVELIDIANFAMMLWNRIPNE